MLTNFCLRNLEKVKRPYSNVTCTRDQANEGGADSQFLENLNFPTLRVRKLKARADNLDSWERELAHVT